MQITETEFLNPEQKQMVLSLWDNEYPENLSQKSTASLESYFDSLTHLKHYLLFEEKKTISGWAFTFERNAENWFAIIISEKIKNLGYGTMLLNLLKTKSHILNGWVIDHNNEKKQNGTTYPSPLNFYLKNGFTLFPAVRLETEKISAVKIEWVKNLIEMP